MGGTGPTRAGNLAGMSLTLSGWATAAGIALAGVAAALVALSVAAQDSRVVPLVAIAAVAGALLALRPWWIVPAFVALTWMAIDWATVGGIPSPVEAGGLALLAVAFLRAPARPAVTREVVLVAALLSLPLLASWLLSEEAVGTPARLLKDLAFLAIPALLVTTPRDVDRVVCALVAVGIFLAAGAAWSVLAAPSALFPLTERTGPFDPEAQRAAGPFGEPNFFALTLAVLVPLALYLLAGKGTGRRVLGGIAVPALFAGIFATGSRGGLIAAGSALVVFALVSDHRGPRLAALALTIAALGLLPLFSAQTSSSSERTVSGRVTENQVALAMFADHPVTGIGVGAYPEVYRDYTREIGDDPRSGRAPHSLPLEILAEQGIAGALGWIGAGLVVASAAAAAGMWRRPLGRALLLALAAYLVGSLFLHGSLLRLLFMLVGLVLAYAFAERRDGAEARA